jgi:signal transduction histidine kinase
MARGSLDKVMVSGSLAFCIVRTKLSRFKEKMSGQTQSRLAVMGPLLLVVVIVITLAWAETITWKQISSLRKEVNVQEVDRVVAFDQEKAAQFLGRINEGLTWFERVHLFVLPCVFLAGVAFLLFAYGRKIPPFQQTVTENRMAIDRQEKLASLGVFATGIAHEIRNPLTAIKVRLFSLKQSHRAGTSESEDLEVIGTEIDRLERIVKDFLQFARPAEPEFKTVSAEALLKNVQELLSSELAKKSVELKVESSPDHLIQVDSNKIKQVLLNLVQNAADSMPKGGTVTMSTRIDRRALLDRPRRVLMIDVTDTGAGMPPEVQKRLFDPFFTTKEHGTGLGLPISARIVERHGGVMEYETQPNRGTTFTIVLPKPTTNETTVENPAG